MKKMLNFGCPVPNAEKLGVLFDFQDAEAHGGDKDSQTMIRKNGCPFLLNLAFPTGPSLW
jgi:hypothetical protein